MRSVNARCPPPATMWMVAADSPESGSTGRLTGSHPVKMGCRSAPVTVMGQVTALVDDHATAGGEG